MIKIKCKFKSNGEDVNKTIIISNNLLRLSKSKANQGSEIIDEIWNDYETWSIIIKDKYYDFELHFKIINGERTLKPDHAKTWIGEDRDIVADSQKLYIIKKWENEKEVRTV